MRSVKRLQLSLIFLGLSHTSVGMTPEERNSLLSLEHRVSRLEARMMTSAEQDLRSPHHMEESSLYRDSKSSEQSLEQDSLYQTLKLRPEYQNETSGQSRAYPGQMIKYLYSKEEQAKYKIKVVKGLIYNAQNRLLDTTSGSDLSGTAIYVMDRNGDFYVSIHASEGSFHHSSLLAGADVAAAGKIRIERGRLKLINDDSGHYKPNATHLEQAFTSLRAHGITTLGVEYGYHINALKKFGRARK